LKLNKNVVKAKVGRNMDYYEKHSTEKARCLECGETLATKDYSTSGLIKHLRQHAELMKKYDQAREQKKSKMAEAAQQQATMDSFVTVSSSV